MFLLIDSKVLIFLPCYSWHCGSMGRARGWDKPRVLWNSCFEAGPCKVTTELGDVTKSLDWCHLMNRNWQSLDVLVAFCHRYGKQTFSGVIKDGISALSRYYLNNFQDGVRQVNHLVLLLFILICLSSSPCFFFSQFYVIFSWVI